MREIELTKGFKAMVDDCDHSYLSQYKWQVLTNTRKTKITYVASVGLWNKFIKTTDRFLMHRLIMGVTDPKVQIDHKDGNSLNNQRENLRVCDNSQNNRNKEKINMPTTSKYKGVSWDRSRNKWCAKIKFNNKSVYLGRFEFEEEAGIAYNEAAIRYFGEFANLNNIPYDVIDMSDNFAV